MTFWSLRARGSVYSWHSVTHVITHTSYPFKLPLCFSYSLSHLKYWKEMFWSSVMRSLAALAGYFDVTRFFNGYQCLVLGLTIASITRLIEFFLRMRSTWSHGTTGHEQLLWILKPLVWDELGIDHPWINYCIIFRLLLSIMHWGQGLK